MCVYMFGISGFCWKFVIIFLSIGIFFIIYKRILCDFFDSKVFYFNNFFNLVFVYEK